MTIIFYDASKEKIYICTEDEKTKILDRNDPKIIDFVPNDDILYVQNAHIVRKEQFKSWLDGEFDFVEDDYEKLVRNNRFQDFTLDAKDERLLSNNKPPKSNKKYLHPSNNGTILISDIPKQYKLPSNCLTPEKQLMLTGKWHFLCLDDLDFDLFEISHHARILLNKKRIEVVDEDYIIKNKEKIQKTTSIADQALQKILLPPNVKVGQFLSNNYGTPENYNEAIQIDVEG